MPNWCNTTIYFYTDKKDIKSLEYFRKELLTFGYKPSYIKNDFGSYWLGNVWYYYMNEDASFVDGARGVVNYIGDIENKDDILYFTLDTETAWSFSSSFWEKILNNKYPEINFDFIAEEIGCGYFVKRDDAGLFSIDYIIDTPEGLEYAANRDEVGGIIKDLGYSEHVDMQNFDSRYFKEIDEDNYIAIFKFEQDCV